MHPNNVVGVTGKYDAVLVLPTQFMLVAECWAVRKKMLNLEAPGKALASTLAGQTVWSSPEVDRELKLLFGVRDERVFDDHIQTVHELLWEDIYWAHMEFLCQVKCYYG